MTRLSIHELEQAINQWRQREPSTGSNMKLGAHASLLAETYATMIVERLSSIELETLPEDVQQTIKQVQTTHLSPSASIPAPVTQTIQPQPTKPLKTRRTTHGKKSKVA